MQLCFAAGILLLLCPSRPMCSVYFLINAIMTGFVFAAVVAAVPDAFNITTVLFTILHY